MIPGNGRFDAVVVGGGVYGILLAIEGAARGQNVLLVERDDFGGGASLNHLRTIHGGLRYLQSLDVGRAVRSNRQQRWWREQFPDLVGPIRCLMPLYGDGLRRPAAFRLAFLLARLLGLHRHDAPPAGRFEVVSAGEVRSLLPPCRVDGLVGGAVWRDAFMKRPHRVLAELVHWAEHAGATVCNRTELTAAARQRDHSWRVSLRDRRNGAVAEVTAKWIISAAGTAVDDVIGRVTGAQGPAILIPTQAWGLLLDHPPVSDCSVAVVPPGQGRRTYFLHPYHGRTLAGTGHAAVNAGAVPDNVPEDLVGAMLDDLNAALPGAGFARAEVRHIFHGMLPGVTAGSDALMMRPAIIDHGTGHDAPGFWTVLGVKFTEAPFVARELWSRLGVPARPLPARPAALPVPTIEEARGLSDDQLRSALRRIAASEWRPTVEDLAWRRTDFWMDDELARRVAALGELAAVEEV